MCEGETWDKDSALLVITLPVYIPQNIMVVAGVQLSRFWKFFENRFLLHCSWEFLSGYIWNSKTCFILYLQCLLLIVVRKDSGVLSGGESHHYPHAVIDWSGISLTWQKQSLWDRLALWGLSPIKLHWEQAGKLHNSQTTTGIPYLGTFIGH